jgi:ubiquinone/menaquinone biosynthesis C-methylase UbiE
MATPWDRPAQEYLEQWVPRFVPYHLDLVRELALVEGQRVLVASSGPGAEVLAVARAVGERGRVRAIDKNPEMVRFCEEQVKKAGFTCVTCAAAEPTDVGDGDYHAIICAFGLWSLPNRAEALSAWAKALAPSGKVGVLTFGPPSEEDPFEILSRALAELEPGAQHTPSRIESARDAMESMFEASNLSLVRHTVLRHTVSFATAEDFTNAISEGRTWRRVWEELGPERMGKVLARFYAEFGGPTAPLTFEPSVTLAIAALPGAEVQLEARPSVRAKPLSSAAPPLSVPKPPDPYKD